MKPIQKVTLKDTFLCGIKGKQINLPEKMLN